MHAESAREVGCRIHYWRGGPMPVQVSGGGQGAAAGLQALGDGGSTQGCAHVLRFA